jgi:pimeloyl-ACP methyl ester carboxylesterase
MGLRRRRATALREHVDEVDGRSVRSLTAAPAGPAHRPHVVIVPGLGALGYLTRLAEAAAAEGSRCTLLDLPGFGTGRPLATPPTVQGVGELTARWLDLLAGSPVILVGHSSGAQAAARAALLTNTPLVALDLAGPTFAPGQRRLWRALPVVAAALRRDSPAELRIVSDYLRGGRDVLALLRSALDDRPEEALPGVTAPLLLTAGIADSLAPEEWLGLLAEAASASPTVRVVRLPGSHNNPFTHPKELAHLVVRCPGEGCPPELRGPVQRQPARAVRALVARAAGGLTRLARRSRAPLDVSPRRGDGGAVRRGLRRGA